MKKVDQHNANVFLVNTGWTGGSYGTGERIKLSYTRAMVHAALEGELNAIETVKDPIFGLEIPMHVAGVPDDLLVPMNTWDDKEAYKQEARELAMKFHENFKKFTQASETIRSAGPSYKGN